VPEPRFSQIGFRDERHGWLMAPIRNDQGPGVFRGGPNQLAHLYATDDAGDSWQKLPDPPAGTYASAFRRSSEAWLGGSSSRLPHVYRSVDGGVTWQRIEIPRPDEPVTAAVDSWSTFVALLPGVGVVVTAFCQCPNSGFDSTSFDGGATWRAVSPPPNSGPPKVRKVAAYQDDVHWWVVDAKTLYNSSDAGQTWIKISDQLPDGEFVPRAIDMKHAWAQTATNNFTSYGLSTTNDAGLHWTSVKVPQSI
jgi:photosystem II stability/assembly factor-like uncharacterized protein